MGVYPHTNLITLHYIHIRHCLQVNNAVLSRNLNTGATLLHLVCFPANCCISNFRGSFVNVFLTCLSVSRRICHDCGRDACHGHRPGGHAICRRSHHACCNRAGRHLRVLRHYDRSRYISAVTKYRSITHSVVISMSEYFST